jgi:hypothetical protein
MNQTINTRERVRENKEEKEKNFNPKLVVK